VSPEQSFWNAFYAWSLALGFVLVVVILILVIVAIHEEVFRNPLAPFIRAFEKRQAHRHRMAELELRARLAKSGVDPEYIKVLEKESRASR
jgi:hypothetical protein